MAAKRERNAAAPKAQKKQRNTPTPKLGKRMRSPTLEPGTIERLVQHGGADGAFWYLQMAYSPEEYRSICASLVRTSRHLSDEQLSKLANAIEEGFPKRLPNCPPLLRRNMEIQTLLMLGPGGGGMNGSQHMPADLFEALDTASRSARYTEADVIERLMGKYELNRGAAKAAFNKARDDLGAKGMPALFFWPKSL